MSLTESTMLGLGTKAPTFALPDTRSGKILNLDEIKSDKATLIMFICNHCPYVIHVNEELVRLTNDYKEKGVSVIAISSNDVENYPQDGPERMREHAEKEGYNFPYLYDETQLVAQAYDAACTPDFYLFDGAMNLAYRGRLDGSRPGSGVPVNGTDLRQAIDAVLANEKPTDKQYPSAGCNIKWKK